MQYAAMAHAAVRSGRADEAQTFAILELAEQQRIANAIALADLHPLLETVEGFQSLDALVYRAAGKDGLRGDKIRPDVAKALRMYDVTGRVNPDV